MANIDRSHDDARFLEYFVGAWPVIIRVVKDYFVVMASVIGEQKIHYREDFLIEFVPTLSTKI